MTMFGRFDLRDLLGQGEFTAVYRAWDPDLGREVALKMLLPQPGESDVDRARFVAEGRLVATLRHPHLVSVHDVGEADGRPYCTMELLPGRTLAAELRDGVLPLGRVLTVVRSVAEALDAIHGRGLVHRDIRPSSVMATTDGRIILLEPFIARAAAGTPPTAPYAGKPAYAAPEMLTP